MYTQRLHRAVALVVVVKMKHFLVTMDGKLAGVTLCMQTMLAAVETMLPSNSSAHELMYTDTNLVLLYRAKFREKGSSWRKLHFGNKRATVCRIGAKPTQFV